MCYQFELPKCVEIALSSGSVLPPSRSNRAPPEAAQSAATFAACAEEADRFMCSWPNALCVVHSSYELR